MTLTRKKSKTDTKASREKVTKIQAKTIQKAGLSQQKKEEEYSSYYSDEEEKKPVQTQQKPVALAKPSTTQKVAPAFSLVFEKKPEFGALKGIFFELTQRNNLKNINDAGIIEISGNRKTDPLFPLSTTTITGDATAHATSLTHS